MSLCLSSSLSLVQEYEGPGMVSRVDGVLGMPLSADDGEEVTFANAETGTPNPYLFYGPDDVGASAAASGGGGTGGPSEDKARSKSKRSSSGGGSSSGATSSSSNGGGGSSSAQSSRPKSASRKR